MPALWQLIKYEAKYRSLLGALALLAHFKSPTPRTSRCVYHLGKVGGKQGTTLSTLKAFPPSDMIVPYPPAPGSFARHTAKPQQRGS